MKAVLQRILRSKLHYHRLPFFQFLRDDSRPNTSTRRASIFATRAAAK